MQKTHAGFSEAVENTGEGGVQIEEGADKGQSPYVGSGCSAVKQKVSQKVAKQQEKEHTGDTHQRTAVKELFYHTADPLFFSQRL